MLGALFCTYGKFIAAHPGMIAEADIRTHFRQNVWRYWRRIRRQRPWAISEVIAAIMLSHIRTPEANNYRRFGETLAKMPP